MLTIYKYRLEEVPINTIMIPEDAKILHVGLQEDAPHIWVEVDTSKLLTKRIFYTIGTGHAIPDTVSTHVGTWQHGSYVWHLYE